MLDTDGMQLHLGILLSRLQKLKGKMNGCLARMDHPEAEKHGFDKETEELEFKRLEQEFEATDALVVAYENEVLELTKLS